MKHDGMIGNLIRCPRCRWCVPCTATNLRNSRTIVWCGKLGSLRPINLHGCLMADPGMALKVKGRWRGGDKLRHAHEMEEAFLRAHYPSAEWPFLTSVLGRSRPSITHIANRLGLVRADKPEWRTAAAARTQRQRQKRGEVFNAAQAAYIEECFREDFWPRKHFGREPGKSRSEAIKAEITARVNALDVRGKVWEWRSIWAHTKWTSPSYKRDQAARNQRRRAYRNAWKARRAHERSALDGAGAGGAGLCAGRSDALEAVDLSICQRSPMAEAPGLNPGSGAGSSPVAGSEQSPRKSLGLKALRAMLRGGAHPCLAPDCTEMMEGAHPLCARHWPLLSADLRARLFEKGQQARAGDRVAVFEYQRACKQAVAVLSVLPAEVPA
jgi:hypothetical protein